MGLVNYDSDSGSSEGEQVAAAPKAKVPLTSATATASSKKQPFQKLVDRANPGKIVVSLPSTAAGEDAEAEDDGRPAKRARVGAAGSSRFSSFGSFLPPPKKTAATTKPSAGEEVLLPGTLRQSVNLKTSSEAAFSRQRAQTADGSSSSSTKMSLPPPKAPSIPEDQKAAEDVKLVGNPLMFMPLSVSRKPGGKKKTAGKGATSSQANKAGTAKTEEAPAPPKKKVSLFSLGVDVEEEAAAAAAAGGDVEDDVSLANTDSTYQPLFETSEREEVQQEQQQQKVQQQPSGSLDALADDLRLTARERRELFGRAGAGAAVASATFNMDQEYRHNEKARLAGEADQRQQAHNPVRAVQPGKHSLRQLVTAVQTQQDALEETFAKNRAAQRESGSRYGWR